MEIDNAVQGKLLEKARKQCQISYDFCNVKRGIMMEDYALWDSQRKPTKKINVTEFFDVMRTLMAVSVSDQLSVEFSDVSADEDTSYVLNKVWEEDYVNMGMDKINYLMHYDKFMCGVGIRQCTDWDEENNCPIVKYRDPITWYPDPNYMLEESSISFHGFEVYVSKEEIESDKFEEGAWEIARKGQADYYNKHGSLGDAKKMFKLVNHSIVEKREDGVVLMEWHLELDGKKYNIWCDLGFKKILRGWEVEPILETEKKSGKLIPFGITLNHFFPEKYNPYGWSVPDVIRDKHKAIGLYENLSALVEKARLHPMFAYNARLVQNIRDLDFSFGGLVRVEDGDPRQALVPIQKDLGVTNGTIDRQMSLRRFIEKSTGATELQQGISPSGDQTKHEIQQMQLNNDIKLNLGKFFDDWGDKKLALLWFRMYKKNFAKSKNKIISINSGFGVVKDYILGKDFLSFEYPKVRIISSNDKKSKNKKELLDLNTITLPIVLQDPNSPQISRRYIKRKALELSNRPIEEIEVVLPFSPDEVLAFQENELLRAGYHADVKPEQDHLSHMVIHRKEKQTPSVLAHIQTHMVMYTQFGGGQNVTDRELDLQENLTTQAQAQLGAMNTQQMANSSL